MDTIGLSGHWEKHGDDYFLKVKLLLNGDEYYKGYIDIYSLFWWTDHKRTRYDVGEISWSCFEPFSCSCGIAGCAGIQDGIFITLGGSVDTPTVRWDAAPEHGYGFLPKRHWEFCRGQYEEEKRAIIEWLSFYKEDRYLLEDNGHEKLTVKQFLQDLKKSEDNKENKYECK